MNSKFEILKKDSKFLWHPFTQIKNNNKPIIIESAKNEILQDIDGNDCKNNVLHIFTFKN